MHIARRRFQTAELMQQAVDNYFAEVEANQRKPTLTGMALYLGFSTLGSLRRYENYPDQDFKWVLDTARMRVMSHLEEYGKTAFDKFLLGSIDPDNWKERTEQVVDVTNRLETKEEKSTAIAKITAQAERRIAQTLDLHPDPEKDNSWI